jgi:hypothetical protein
LFSCCRIKDEVDGFRHDSRKDAHNNDIKSSGAMGTSGGGTDGNGGEVMEFDVLTRNEVVVGEEDLVGVWSFNNYLSRLVGQTNFIYSIQELAPQGLSINCQHVDSEMEVWSCQSI